jgi:hypothetical protein
MDEIIGQILGIVATVITAISYQVNHKRGLLAVQSAATLSTCLSYLFLGAMSGFALNIVCLVRNGVFFFFDKSKKGVVYRIAAALLAACMVVLGVLSWQGWVSLLIIVALALNTLFMAFGTPQRLRQSVCFTSALVLAYNICVFSIGGIMNEALAIISSVVGILRYRKEKGQAAEN